MPISVTCRECDASYRVADEAVGKAIKCKKCGARISVPGGADDEEPAGDGADADGAAPPKKGKGKLIGIIVGALLFVTCCICTPITGGGVWWFGFKDKDKVQKGAGGGGLVILPAGTMVLEKKETLTNQDPKLKINSILGAFVKPVRQYKVKLDAHNKYRIEMAVGANSPGGAEPFFILLDPQGEEVGRNDNIGGFRMVMIQYAPAVTGEFTIQASAFVAVPPGGMPFTLTVRTE